MTLVTVNPGRTSTTRQHEKLEYTTTNDFHELAVYRLVHMDVCNLIPFTNNNAGAVLKIEVSYDEPQYEEGAFIPIEDTETVIDPETFEYRPYDEIDVLADTSGKDNKYDIVPFQTGVAVIRLSAKSKVADTPADLTLYTRGYYIQR